MKYNASRYFVARGAFCSIAVKDGDWAGRRPLNELEMGTLRSTTGEGTIKNSGVVEEHASALGSVCPQLLP
jgi:hypothetical protein